MAKPCSWCESTDHTSFYCRQKVNKPLARSTEPLKRTALRQQGKHAQLWKDARKHWLNANKKQSYRCHYCGTHLTIKTVTLDHKVSRSRAPELRYKMSNLVPCCWNCNTLKGSVSHDEFVHVCH